MAVTYLPRVLDAVLARRLASAGAVVLEGPKACGKTRTAEQHATSAVHLDTDPAALAAIDVDPALVLAGAAPLLVDEWQLAATRVWNHVRADIDARRTPGQFILTGSSVPEDDVRRHAGAGRFARLMMRPMSLFESGESTGDMSLADLMTGHRPQSAATPLRTADIADLVVRGGWPLNLGLSVTDAAQANADYVTNICEVDVSRMDETRRDPFRVRRFLQAVARNVATEVSITTLVADVDEHGTLARSTAYDYLPALRRLMVIESQPPWSVHLRSRARLRKAEKMHLVDPSLAAAVLGALPERLLADLQYFGLLFESLVVRDVRVHSEPLAASVHHYRDSDGLEVDIVVQTPAGPWGAFEVKLGVSQVDAAAAHLLAFASKVDTAKSGPPAVLGVITATGFGYTRPDGVVVIPIGSFGP